LEEAIAVLMIPGRQVTVPYRGLPVRPPTSTPCSASQNSSSLASWPPLHSSPSLLYTRHSPPSSPPCPSTCPRLAASSHSIPPRSLSTSLAPINTSCALAPYILHLPSTPPSSGGTPLSLASSCARAYTRPSLQLAALHSPSTPPSSRRTPLSLASSGTRPSTFALLSNSLLSTRLLSSNSPLTPTCSLLTPLLFTPYPLSPPSPLPSSRPPPPPAVCNIRVPLRPPLHSPPVCTRLPLHRPLLPMMNSLP
jgi:hypothetical protein